MMVTLRDFQQKALAQLRRNLAMAADSYERYGVQQVISFTAPTGAGKTITAAALIEAVLLGDEDGKYPAAGDSVFLWLSDSPELNEQSKNKIISCCAPSVGSLCEIITEETFHNQMLDDGKIYFLNTQKLSVKSRLVQHSDDRTYTIWEVLSATARKKGERFFVIIDEAHRGMLDKRGAEATTIMQKFLKGSAGEIPPMPIVVGMSATIEHFHDFVGKIEEATQYHVEVNKNDVIRSGLLKEKIILAYPETQNSLDAYTTLHAAAEDWKDKREHWTSYCEEQLFGEDEKVNPVFIIQVQNQDNTRISITNLDECVSIIEERADLKFRKGEVVHTFGDKKNIKLKSGYEILYEDPSAISADTTVMVVFFKENLSTGWDCPRAETMMSFRRATDATYIAQLLGRMVRTPLKRRIDTDETLNDVRLFLPFFDKDTVQKVAKELQNSDIVIDIVHEPTGKTEQQTLTRKPAKPDASNEQLGFGFGDNDNNTSQTQGNTANNNVKPSSTTTETEKTGDQTVPPKTPKDENKAQTERKEDDTTKSKVDGKVFLPPTPPQQKPLRPAINRQAVSDYINNLSLPTCLIEKHALVLGRYLKSLYAISRLLVQTGVYKSAIDEAKGEVASMIRKYRDDLEQSGEYTKKVEAITKIKFFSQQFNVSGEKMEKAKSRRFSYAASNREIDRKFDQAEARLGGEGVANEYGRRYGDEKHPDLYKIDVILFAADEACGEQLEVWAKERFTKLADTWRIPLTRISDDVTTRYKEITSTADTVSIQTFRLPETIQAPKDEGGKLYSNHLFVDKETGTARIKLNSWEEELIRAEVKRDDFVCWIRNLQNSHWGLCLSCKVQGETKGFYPDFIVIRKYGDGYVMDILEPHGQQFSDSLAKAKSLAEYAEGKPVIGRVQMARMAKDSGGKERLRRLEFAGNIEVQQKVRKALTHEELDHLFDTYGFFDQ